MPTLLLDLGPETRDLLDRLADFLNTEPEKLVHQWIRGWVFDALPGQSSFAAQASALVQRGTLPLMSGGRVTKAQLEEAVPRFSFPPVAPENGHGLLFELPVSRRVADVLPRTIAYVEQTMTPDQRAKKDWNSLSDWARELVAGKCAEEGAKMEAKEAADEEAALFPFKGSVATIHSAPKAVR